MTSNIEPSKDPFDYLWNLVDVDDGVIPAGDYAFRIKRHTAEGTKALSLEIYDKEHNGKHREIYNLGIEEGFQGVYDMLFEFPSLTDVPPAPTGTPAEMTDEEAKKLAFDRAVKVAEFVNTQLNPKLNLPKIKWGHD
jgi:hypothetical protein